MKLRKETEDELKGLFKAGKCYVWSKIFWEGLSVVGVVALVILLWMLFQDLEAFMSTL